MRQKYSETEIEQVDVNGDPIQQLDGNGQPILNETAASIQNHVRRSASTVAPASFLNFSLLLRLELPSFHENHPYTTPVTSLKIKRRTSDNMASEKPRTHGKAN